MSNDDSSDHTQQVNTQSTSPPYSNQHSYSKLTNSPPPHPAPQHGYRESISILHQLIGKSHPMCIKVHHKNHRHRSQTEPNNYVHQYNAFVQGINQMRKAQNWTHEPHKSSQQMRCATLPSSSEITECQRKINKLVMDFSVALHIYTQYICKTLCHLL